MSDGDGLTTALLAGRRAHGRRDGRLGPRREARHLRGYSVFYETYLDPMPGIWKHMYKNHFYVLFLINHCV